MSEEWCEIQSGSKTSSAWQYFLTNKKDILKCKHCGSKFKKQSSTSTFKYRLDHKHGIKVEVSNTDSMKAKVGHSQTSIIDYFKQGSESPELVVSRIKANRRQFWEQATKKVKKV